MSRAGPVPPEVPGWEILARVGAGAMGTVWKARRADGTLAALKVSDGPPRRGDAAGSLFRRESLACLNLDHPHLVRGLDVGTTADGRPFLAMEFVEGRTLSRAVRDDGPLPEARLVAVAAALARALDHVHRLGLVHRDVKPSNVLIGDGGAVKLADLGLVVESAASAGAQRMGTRPYLAPEIVAGAESDARTDLYALGATLAEAATGERREEVGAWTDAHLPETVGGAPLSPGVRAVVERLLRAERGQRYASAGELLLDLDALAAGERPLGAILGRGAAAVPRTRRAKTAVAIGAVGLAGAAWAVWFAATREPSPAAPVAPAAGTPSPAGAEDAHLTAARVYAEQFPDDFPRIRTLLDEAGAAPLSEVDRSALARLREVVDGAFERACGEAEEDRRKAAAAAAAEHDVAREVAILRDWPANLAGSPRRRALEEEAARRLKLARADAEMSAGLAEAAAPTSLEAARSSVAALDDVLRRAPFDGDQRERLVAARKRLAAILDDLEATAAAARTAAQADRDWRSALSDAEREASSGGGAALLRLAAKGRGPARLVEPAKRVDAARAAAAAAIGSALGSLRGRFWAGPRGDALFVGTVAEPPAAEEVLESPLWLAAGGAGRTLTALAGGPDRAAAWLFVAGDWAEASSDADVAAIVENAESLPTPVAAPLPDDVNAARAPFTLRAPGDAPKIAAPADPVLAAWLAATTSKTRPAPSKDAKAAAAKTAGRDAFLADDLPAAWTHLTEAMRLDPWDAEVAALRGRILLVAARPLPTAPALLLAFSEGRRAGDLDPDLPAASALAAEAGVALCDVAGESLLRDVRPAVAAACEEASRVGRDDARLLQFAGEWRLESGDAAKATELLRRAAAKAPASGPVLVSLARAELAAGHRDRAQEALARATEAFGGALPASADDVVRGLAK